MILDLCELAKLRDVIIGAWLAFLVQIVVAVGAGSVLTLLPAKAIHIASGIRFLVFSTLAFRRKEEATKEENREIEALASHEDQSGWPVFWLYSRLSEGSYTAGHSAAGRSK